MVSPSSGSSYTSSAASSPASRYRDYSSTSDVDELDHRSRKLTSLLKKNVNRAENRKSVLDVVRNTAWQLEDQVRQLEKQTANVRGTLKRKSCKRRLVVFGALIVSLVLIIHRYIPSSHSTSDNHSD